MSLQLPLLNSLACVYRWIRGRRAFLLVGTALLAGWMTSCKPDSDANSSGSSADTGNANASRVRMVLLADNLRTPLRNYQMQLLHSWIRSRPGVDVVEADAADIAQAQAQQVRATVQEGANVLLVFPLLSDDLIAALSEAKSGGVHVVSFGAGLPAKAVTTTISLEGREIGRLAGEFTVKALTQKAQDEGFTEVRGRVVQLRGDEEGGDSELIYQGFAEVLKQQPGIVLVHDAPGNWNDVEAALRMKEASRLQMPFHVIFSHNDLMAKGAIEVAKEAGVRDSLLILGVDGAPGTQGGMEMVRRGDLEATIYRPPLVDVAWSLVQQWLEDRSFAWPQKIEVLPFVMTMEEAAQSVRKGLPEPLLK